MKDKLELHKAKKILENGRSLSLKNWEWDIPLDIGKITEEDRHKIFISFGKWRGTKLPEYYLLLSQNGELIYLNEEILDIIFQNYKKLRSHKTKK